MDLSVFNLLMSTNPNSSAAENLFSGAVQNGVQASADTMQTSLKTGEAFLEVLDQVRNGKTEKSADALYNAFSAHADASSSLSDFRKGGNENKENVKVVKLYIKRTRSSETLRKADEQKAKETTAPQQSGQKIPMRENISASETTVRVQQDEETTNGIIQETGFEVFSIPEQTPLPQKKALVPEEEQTAADILISSMIQSEKQVATPTDENEIGEQTAPTHVEHSFVPSQELNDFSVQTQRNETHQNAKPNEEKQTETQKTPVFTEAAPVINDTENTPDLPEQANSAPVQSVRAEEKHTSSETILFKNIPDEVSLKQEQLPTIENKPVREKTVISPEKQVNTKPVETTEIEDNGYFIQKDETPSSRRQAEQLARQLPVDTNIAVSVEVQSPETKSFAASNVSSSRSFEGKKENKNTEKVQSAFLPFEQTDVSSPENDSAVHFEKPEQTSEQQQLPQAQIPDELTALPVQSKVTLAPSTTANGNETSTTQTNTASTPTALSATISTASQLKGKAVSGNVGVHKNIPMNELVDQIKVNIKKALKEGLDKIDIVLKPKELGTIKIRLEIGKDGAMKVVLNTARAETLDLLQSDLSALKQALTNNGFDLNDQSFSFNYRGERYNREHEQQQNEHNRFHPEETENDELIDSVSSAGSLSFSGRYALNIRV